MKINQTRTNEWTENGYVDLKPAVYLNRLVAVKKALHRFNQHQTITLCGNDLNVQVYRGIGELAFAAGQTLSVTRRDCPDFPIELHFSYDGVSFGQLKSAEAIAALGDF